MVLENTFVHHVHFWLNDKADTQKLIDGLNTLTAIPTVNNIHIGIPAATGGGPVDNSFDASLLILFNNQEEEEAYDTDPIHQRFINNCGPLCAKVVVQDSVNA